MPMKRITLLILTAALLLSCKENSKVSKNGVVENDSISLQKIKKSHLKIDANQASPANFKILLDNEHVRVLEYTLEPGKKDEWHTHPAKVSYVVSGGKVLVHRGNGETIISEEKTGTASWMNAVGKHYVENTGNTTVKVILTEVKSLDELLQTESLTQDEENQVDILLTKLYKSFSYGKAEEPNWELMRSVFVEGAQFVLEVPDGEFPNPQTIEEFISNWQSSIRNSDSSTVETSENIIETRTVKMGKSIRVDVVFQASRANDPSPRKYGLDSLVLVNVDGVWKILSFVIHFESKL
jgi:quercetin dioxygenase-like cupin family protein